MGASKGDKVMKGIKDRTKLDDIQMICHRISVDLIH